MVAMAMFMLMMGSVMACWKVIVSGTETAQRAAAMAQRARISMKTVEDALNNVELTRANLRFYAFLADTSEPQYASLSFAARLPPSFLGSDYFGDRVMRRVNFNVVKNKEGQLDLVMTQSPLLEVPSDNFPPKSIVLARDVSAFVLEFWSPKENDWLSDFLVSNDIPPMIRITLGTGHAPNDPKTPFEVIQRVVAPPSQAYGAGVR